MSHIKCINLGLPKSGTTTLAQALSQAGWSVADHKVRRSQTADAAMAGSFVGQLLYQGYFDAGNPYTYLDDFDALGEINALRGDSSFWPQCDYVMLQAMRVLRPKVRFVATWRPASDIADSMLRWNNLGRQRLPKGSIPGLPHGFGGKRAELEQWISNHYAMLAEIFGNDTAYLELRVSDADAQAQLAAHLGLDLPWWGRANANPDPSMA